MVANFWIKLLFNQLKAAHVVLRPTDVLKERLEQATLITLITFIACVIVNGDAPTIRMPVYSLCPGLVIENKTILLQSADQFICCLVLELVPDIPGEFHAATTTSSFV